MVSLTKIYTRGGDQGQTSLGDGSRRPKHDLRIASYGEVDELNATLGLVRLEISGELDQLAARIQNDLFDLGADLCVPEDGRKAEGALRITEDQVTAIEQAIDQYNENLSDLKSFILPGGSRAAAYLHLSRTVARRAERHLCLLAEQEDINPACIKYLNRLSDLFFVLARHENNQGVDDVLWVPGANR